MTYIELLSSLTSFERLATPPAAGEYGGCFSSYDRASVYDAQTDTYAGWDANADGSGYIRALDDGGIVAVEMEGPGVIWRTWSALPKQGEMRIYFDGEAEPSQRIPFIDFFDAYRDDPAPNNLPSLVPTLSRGRNSFIPIPFQKSIRIELAEGWGAYYHFTYKKFPRGTQMPAYTDRFLPESEIALAALDRVLYGRSHHSATPATQTRAITVALAPHEQKTLWKAAGSGAICALRFLPQSMRGPMDAQLRAITLSMHWDGDERPAVWAPLGDFFGHLPGVTRMYTLPVGCDDFCYYANWYMPYANGAAITLCNDGEQPQTLSFEIDLAPLPKDEADLMLRFHAKWHRGQNKHPQPDRFLPGGDRWPDWPLLQTEGTGRFCGIHLHVYDAWNTPATPPKTWWYGNWHDKTIDWWWGEGDEKFFIDGEKFPSSFGTGSEDYFGYAWAAEQPVAVFDSAYAAMHTPLNSNGHTYASRYHICDDVPFYKTFDGYMEKYKADDWGDGNKCLFAVTALWYQAPHQDDGYGEVPLDERWGEYGIGGPGE